MAENKGKSGTHGKSEGANQKPNHGQDEVQKFFSNGTETLQLTSRQYRDGGFAKKGYDEVPEPTEQAPLNNEAL